jgi:hypothetical protein
LLVVVVALVLEVLVAELDELVLEDCDEVEVVVNIG